MGVPVPPLYRSFQIISDNKAVAALHIMQAVMVDLSPSERAAVLAFLTTIAAQEPRP
jgi:hypothetical protein